jgi:hexokinase
MKQSFALLDVGGTDIKSCIANNEDSHLQEIYRSKTPGNIQKAENELENNNCSRLGIYLTFEGPV